MVYLFIILACMVYCAPARAQAFQWTTYTSTSNVVDMLVMDGRVWTATSGGLSSYDPVSESFDVYTNTRGLAMNNCVAIGKDSHGFIWVGLSDGRITRLDPRSGEVRQVVDLQQDVFEITDVLDVGDEVFVSANNGIYRFAYFAVADNFRIIESVKLIGSFPLETRVSALALSEGYLYAGTAIGLARASLSQPTLSAPSAWQNFSSASGLLPENEIRAIQGYASIGTDTLCISTPSWVVMWADTHVAHLQNVGFVRRFSPSSLWGCASRSEVWYWAAYGGVPSWHNTNDTLSDIYGLDDFTVEGVRRAVVGVADGSRGNGGLSLSIYTPWPGTAQWSRPLRSQGIGGNMITALGVDPHGRLWIGGSGFTAGVYLRNEGEWTNYTRSTGYSHHFFRSPPQGFVFDDHAGSWVSSQGGGVAWFHRDSITIFDSVDSTGFGSSGARLSPVPAHPPSDTNFVVTRVARSPDGSVYITNRLTQTDLPLARVPAEWIARGNNRDPWDYYVQGPVSVANYEIEVEEVFVDYLNRVWIGSTRDGRYTYVLDDDGSPSDTTDDTWFSYIPSDRADPVTCFEAMNHEVLDWVVDQQGYLWIGTVNGAYRTESSIPYSLNQLRFICVYDLPVGQQVRDIEVDGHDNKWFATDQGVAVLDKNFVWIHVFQSSGSVDHPSDLVSNDVSCITSDPATGEIWIGTSDGLSRFCSPYVARSGGLSDLWPYPNPFRADGTQRLRVDPVRLGNRFDDLRVYTVSGRLVRKLNWAQMTDPGGGGWDGRNDDGVLVAGGVYLLMASTSDGQSAVGKVAVLGR